MQPLLLRPPVSDPPAAPSGKGGRPAWTPILTCAGILFVLLIAFAGGYGYHRDELYFIAAGRHLALAYPDQGPLTPLLARLMTDIAPGSLTMLRLPSALASAGTVTVAGLTAFEFGGNRRAQAVAAACTAVASVVLVVGHLLSTTTFDVLAWTVAVWLLVRLLRTGDQHLLPVMGSVIGVALLNKPLIAFLMAGLLLGLLVCGPRALLRSAWLWAAVLLALLLWSPWLAWQAAHDWPQLDVSSSIASGGSASSQPRWALLPFQFLLVSPLLAPIWIIGLWKLLRESRLRPYRLIGVAWVFLAGVFTVTGGKPYYLAGMFPALLAAGAISTDRWLSAGAKAWRGRGLAAALAVSAVVSAMIALPVLPARNAGVAVAINSDAGETIGWPEMVGVVARVWRQTPTPAIIVASNYGEAGAIDRFGPQLGLPQAFSGHNGYGYWGLPTDQSAHVVLVGRRLARQLRLFQACRLRARIHERAGIDNEEQGAPVYTCRGAARPWAQLSARLRRLG